MKLSLSVRIVESACKSRLLGARAAGDHREDDIAPGDPGDVGSGVEVVVVVGAGRAQQDGPTPLVAAAPRIQCGAGAGGSAFDDQADQ